MMNIKFVLVYGSICRRSDLAALEKLLISLIWGFQKTTGKFFGSVEWVAEQLGTSEEKVWHCLERLQKKGIVQKIGDEWYVQQLELLNENYPKSPTGAS